MRPIIFAVLVLTSPAACDAPAFNINDMSTWPTFSDGAQYPDRRNAPPGY